MPKRPTPSRPPWGRGRARTGPSAQKVRFMKLLFLSKKFSYHCSIKLNRRITLANRTAEEIKRELIKQLGEDFGTELYWIENAFTNLNVEWQIFHYFFVAKEERVDLLNKASGITSYFLSKVLHESIAMGLCRLTDPYQSGRGAGQNQNLSLASLKRHISGRSLEEYTQREEAAKDACQKARDWRNKLISHADLSIATRKDEISGISPRDMQNALEKIGDALNFLNLQLFDSTTMYDDVILQLDDHRKFLRTLFVGNNAWEEIKEQQKAALDAKNYSRFEELRKMTNLPDWIYSD